MKISTILLAILIAAPALRAESSQTPIPAPDFMTPTQLAVWSQQKHEKAMAAQAAQATAAQSAPGVFYTGKPYLAESGTYSFLARQYNPEMARWTTVDPSGFPDGPNNRVYAAVPTSNLDSDGESNKPVSNTSTTAANITANDMATATANAMKGISTALQGTSLSASLVTSIISWATDQINTKLPKLTLSGYNVSERGTADYDTVAKAFSNQGLNVTADCSGLGFSINGTIGGCGVNFGLSYALSYSLSGGVTTANVTTTSENLLGTYVPTLTSTITCGVTPGASVNATGNVFEANLYANVPLVE